MKKVFNRVKTWLLALWVTIITFFAKAMGQGQFVEMYWVPGPYDDIMNQGVYWVPPVESKANLIIKVIQRALVGVVFIIWIINLIKIKKTDDKVQRKKRIRKTIIIVSILVILLAAAFLVPTLLLNK